MKNILTYLGVLTLFLVASGGVAQAQATRTWVSGVGDDANPCSRTAPCKTWAGAISKTAPSGEIDALDPGGFGAVTITKAITLDGGGGQNASVLVSGTNGIVVATGASDVVTIRNLSINGIGTGINGILFQSGGTLHVEHCVIFGFTGNGLDIQPNTGGRVTVLDTISRDNGGSGIYGFASSASIFVTINRSRFENNVIGVFASDSSQFTVKDSDASSNSYAGFAAVGSGSSSSLNITSSVAGNNNSVGILSGGGGAASVVSLNGVTVAGNGSLALAVGTNGSIVSFSNNYISGSGSPTSHVGPQ